MAELNVSRKTVSELLSLNSLNTRGKKYIIPDYQRPYNWDRDTCETLWVDLVNFFTDHKNDSEEYFLGSIVTCIDDNNSNDIDIIDGQQRITSLLLLLRAFYTKLEMMLIDDKDNEEVIGLMQSIEPCIWNINKLTKKVSDKKDIHIFSKVAIADDNEIFHTILETGQENLESKSKYATNYSFFMKNCNDYASNHPMDWKEFCLCILDRCIILPIECTKLDSALTIFGTLNNRGLPLADSDIFKSQLFKLQQTPEEKAQFTEKWKELEIILNEADINFNDIFRYYTHVIRARNNDASDEKSLRLFYAGEKNKYKIFSEETDLLDKLISLAEFWRYAKVPEEDIYNSELSQKYLQILNAYPNDFWRYPVSVYFFKHKDDNNFKEQFSDFLAKLTSYLLMKFIERPTVSFIRRGIYKYCIDINNTGTANFSCEFPSDFEDRFNELSTSRITRSILLLNAYEFDKNQPYRTFRNRTYISKKVAINSFLSNLRCGGGYGIRGTGNTTKLWKQDTLRKGA